MKLFALATLALLSASHAQAAETRITGAAAQELYQSLNLPETAVRDEHGGADYAVAKYGRHFGCSKDLSSGQVECWILR